MEQIDLGVPVPDSTRASLAIYVALLEKWNRHINLVAKSTATNMWQRHIVDSSQLWRHAPQHVSHWLDLGSGGGLPGLVVAIIGRDLGRLEAMTLVESDQRKAVFLMEAIRQLSLSVQVRTERIETIAPVRSDVISARALAELSTLFRFSEPHLLRESVLLLPKGASHKAEIETAMQDWQFDVTTHPSLTDGNAAILEISKLARRQGKG